MPCSFTLRAAALLASAALPLSGQQPAPPTAPPAVDATYRLPAIALVQPPDGGTVPRDRPVVVFRFAPGEPADPLDLTSFRVAVADQDRTELFQVAATEAWGPLAPAGDGADELAPGPHSIAARICSVRGACALISATLTVAPDPAANQDSPALGRREKRGRLLTVILDAVRKLLLP